MHAQHARRWLTAVLTRARAGAPTDATTRNECGPRAGGARTGGWSKAPSSLCSAAPAPLLAQQRMGGCRVAARPDGPVSHAHVRTAAGRVSGDQARKLIARLPPATARPRARAISRRARGQWPRRTPARSSRGARTRRHE